MLFEGESISEAKAQVPSETIGSFIGSSVPYMKPTSPLKFGCKIFQLTYPNESELTHSNESPKLLSPIHILELEKLFTKLFSSSELIQTILAP